MVVQKLGGCCRDVMSGTGGCSCRGAGGQWLCLIIVCGACSLRISMVILYPVKVAVMGRTRGSYIDFRFLGVDEGRPWFSGVCSI